MQDLYHQPWGPPVEGSIAPPLSVGRCRLRLPFFFRGLRFPSGDPKPYCLNPQATRAQNPETNHISSKPYTLGISDSASWKRGAKKTLHPEPYTQKARSLFRRRRARPSQATASCWASDGRGLSGSWVSRKEVTGGVFVPRLIEPLWVWGFIPRLIEPLRVCQVFFFFFSGFLWDFCGGLSGSCIRTDCPTTPFWSSNIPKFGGSRFKGRGGGCGGQASGAVFPGFQGLLLLVEDYPACMLK